MPSILNLKFKGNKSFVAFSNLNDTESLTKTWKVCTKVASFLEQGQRLENLSWRLWHLQNLMVDTDNAKSKREFKKLSKCMGDKLDKEKGRSIEELEAPDFKRNHSTDMIRQRAVEKERNREASQNATPGTIKRMQFTFSVDQPSHSVSSAPVKRPDTKPSAEFAKRGRTAPAARTQNDHEDTVMADADESSAPQSLHFPSLFSNSFGPSALLYAAPTLTTRMNYGEGFNPSGSNDQFSISRPTIELPLDEILFNDEPASENGSNDMWSSALNTLGGHHHLHSNNNMTRDNSDSNRAASLKKAEVASSAAASATSSSAGQQQDVVMGTSISNNACASVSAPTYASATPSISVIGNASARRSSAASSSASTASSSAGGANADDENGSSINSDDEDIDQLSPAPSTAKRTSIFKGIAPLSQAVKEILPETVAPSRMNNAAAIYGTRSSTPTGRPTLTLRTQTTVTTRSSGPGATATSLTPAVLRGSVSSGGLGNSAPGGVKAECSNCGATHTPLWRRGLNDELNCNACGLYCKLHKRPRPKSMRNSHGEGRAQAAPRPETVDVMVAAQCYNCHTTATPLWRKDDEGKTVCNACGLYYKLHGSARPISMKSDVIRKRSRHDARRVGNGPEDTPSASPGVSRRTSPVPEASPTLAPDSTTQMSYDFAEDNEYRGTTTSSELMGALGGSPETVQTPLYNNFHLAYPGPYHPDYIMQLYNLPPDALPFSTVESSEIDLGLGLSPRSTKRRRMSTDSASEPPSSAVSFSSYGGGGDGYSSASSSTASHSHSHSHSKRSSMEFPFSTYNSNGTINQGPALRGSGNTFWHPPMMPQSNNDSEHLFHPPMLPPSSNASSGTGTPSTTSSSGTNGSAGSHGHSGGGGGVGSSGSSSSSDVGNDDSPMDYLHPPMALQDEESLFSAYLHPPMALPEEKNVSGQDANVDANGGPNGMHQQMYVDSYFQ